MGEQPSHIVTLSDETPNHQEIKDYLIEHGFEMSSAPDIHSLRRILRRRPPDLVILDAGVTDSNVFDLTAELRQWPDTGVIVLGERDDLIDTVAGLESGADDFLGRPFHRRELLARIRSVLRRCGRENVLRKGDAGRNDAGNASAAPRGRFAFQGWVLNLDGRQLLSPDGNPVDLPGGEFDLLVALVEHAGRALSREELAELAKGPDAAPVDRGIDVQIGRLRRKLETDPRRPAIIKTVRGVGYLFAAEVTEF